MRTAVLQRTMRATCIAVLLALGAASNAYAQDAYWHGIKNADWNEGISPGDRASNWYSRPPSPPASGTPLQPPTGVAIFAADPLTSSLSITEVTRIATMRILPDAPQYGFGIVGLDRRLTVHGKGIINQTRTTPPRIIAGQDGVLEFTNASRISGVGRWNAEITVLGGFLAFRDDSNGGNARVFNTKDGDFRGVVAFHHNSSASEMTINNVGGAKTVFHQNSTPGNAHLINNADPFTQEGARIEFWGDGPAGDGKVTAGKLTNNAGTLDLGDNEVTVRQGFTQLAEGVLGVWFFQARAGGLVVKGASKIDGALVVHGTNATVGRYVLLRAQGGRTGTFSRVRFTNFPTNLKARIAYSGNDVVLFVERK